MKKFLICLAIAAVAFFGWRYITRSNSSGESTHEATVEVPVSNTEPETATPSSGSQSEVLPEVPETTTGTYTGNLPGSHSAASSGTPASVSDPQERQPEESAQTEEPPSLFQTLLLQQSQPKTAPVDQPKTNHVYFMEDYNGLQDTQKTLIHAEIVSLFKRFSLELGDEDNFDYEFYIDTNYDIVNGVGRMDAYLLNVATDDLTYWSIPARAISDSDFITEILASFRNQKTLDI